MTKKGQDSFGEPGEKLAEFIEMMVATPSASPRHISQQPMGDLVNLLDVLH